MRRRRCSGCRCESRWTAFCGGPASPSRRGTRAATTTRQGNHDPANRHRHLAGGSRPGPAPGYRRHADRAVGRASHTDVHRDPQAADRDRAGTRPAGHRPRGGGNRNRHGQLAHRPGSLGGRGGGRGGGGGSIGGVPGGVSHPQWAVAGRDLSGPVGPRRQRSRATGRADGRDPRDRGRGGERLPAGAGDRDPRPLCDCALAPATGIRPPAGGSRRRAGG